MSEWISVKTKEHIPTVINRLEKDNYKSAHQILGFLQGMLLANKIDDNHPTNDGT